MGNSGLKYSLILLAAAFGGVGSSVAYFGVCCADAMPAPALNQVLRFTLPDAVLPSEASGSDAPQEAQELASSSQPAEKAEPASAQQAAQPAGAAQDLLPQTRTANAAENASPPALLAHERHEPGSLRGLSYDLAGGADSVNAIQTEKAIQIPGSSPFKVGVRIDENSAIYVDARQLASLLPDTVPSTGYISLDELRSRGVQVRYDAAIDTIELQPGGA